MRGYAIELLKVNTKDIKPSDRRIVCWKKGGSDTNEVFWKCNGYSPLGYFAEGIGRCGQGREDAIKDLFKWFDILDKEGE